MDGPLAILNPELEAHELGVQCYKLQARYHGLRPQLSIRAK